ncbi:hypothetical protein [Imhoffiella purpurea]|uniref:Uncharacterized protein n=1 Tax=Imhoffiella purpurea TaxID=1249627 RepID=W9V6P9_9GAMM|nr:hypothetical protein [Imhoffiella purpurea]EXJ15069.1 hypothetical protein D779_1623 [Imhoffiella purpurea]
MYKNSSMHFDPDLDQILNRVYGAGDKINSEPGSSAASFRQSVVHRERVSLELKQALNALRDRREKSQQVMRMKAELAYLKTQIARLRELDRQIVTLRTRLEKEDPEGPIVGTLPLDEID